MKQSLQLLADYNRTLNQQVYTAAQRLSPTQLAQDRGAFFGSILATLNHLLVGDILWLQRCAKHHESSPVLKTLQQMQTPHSLDTILYRDLSNLWQARQTMDTTIEQYVNELSEADLAAPLCYSNTRGQQHQKNLGQVLLHVFNHQTHHRGQVSTLLHQAGIDIGVTDLIVHIAEQPV